LTKIYLIRHAEAEGNIYRRAHGHYNGLVTPKGYKQIAKLRERFMDIHIDAVYSSDLSRAMVTAQAVAESHGLSVETTDKLREVDLGQWEDVAWGDIEFQYREMIAKFNNDPAGWSVPGSESYENVQSRMNDFIIEAAKQHDGGSIAVFSHGFAIRSLLCLLKNIPSNETDSNMPYCDNTGVGLLVYEDGKLKVEQYNCNVHLSNEVSTLAKQAWWRTEKRHVSENLRYMKLSEVCTEELLRIFQAKAGGRASVDMQYAAFLADQPVGIVGIDTKRDSKIRTGWISYIHVIPAHRKKTFATQLLGLAVSDFRKLRREKLRMEIPSGSLGINFMNRCGFDVIDVTDQLCLMEMNIRNW